MTIPNRLLAVTIGLFVLLYWLVSEMSYRSGLQFSTPSFLGMIIVFPYILMGIAPYLVAVIQILECCKKRDPWKSLVVTGILISCHVFAGKIPFRNNLDGVSKRLSSENLEMYILAAKEFEKLDDTFSENSLKPIFEMYPALASAGSWPPRFMSESDEFVDIFWGGAMGGYRGARVFTGEREPIPPSDSLYEGEYLAKYVQVHPMVWAFVAQ